MFGYDTDAIFIVVRKVIMKLLSWVWDRVKDYLLAHWKEIVIVSLLLLIFGLVKIIIVSLGLRQILHMPVQKADCLVF